MVVKEDLVRDMVEAPPTQLYGKCAAVRVKRAIEWEQEGDS